MNQKIKGIYRDGQRWLIFHNKNVTKELSDNHLDLIRIDKETSTVECFEYDFSNVRQCMRFINNWRK